MQFKGEKVVLREKRVEDAEDDYAWRCDPELAAFDGVSPLKMSFNSFLAVYKEEIRYASSRHRTLAIEDETGWHIGNCMYYDTDEAAGQAELGIMVGDRNYWGRGYGTDAVNTLLRYIFTTTRLNRIYLHTLDWNVRAQKSFAKSGFVTIGEIQRNGQVFITMEVYRSWIEDKLGVAVKQKTDTALSPEDETSPNA